VAAFAGSFAVWLDRQALSDAGWARTSSHLIANQQIRDALGDYAVRELLTAAHVPGTVRSLLPEPIAAQVLTTLRGLGRRLAASILASAPARTVWGRANRQAHHELMAILDRRAAGNVRVSLNLTPLLGDLVKALYASAPVQALPGGQRLFDVGCAGAGELPVLRGDQVRRVRAVVNAVRGLSVVLSVAAAALFAAAVAVAVGWRRVVLRRAGYCLIAVGALVLVLRWLGGPALADTLVAASSASTQGAVRAAWTIATSELRDTAVAVLLAGAVCVGLGLLSSAGARRRAVT